MDYIVLGRGSGATLLAQALQGRAIKPTDMPLRELKRLYRDPRVCVINWGWSTAWANLNRMGRRDRWCKDKYKASVAMGDISVTYNSPGVADEFLKFPALARSSKHSKGRDVILVNSRAEWNALTGDRYRHYTVPVFKKDREYRAHVLHGEVIKLQRKIPEDPAELVWSNDHARFSRVRLTNPSYAGILDVAVRAVEALGLDMGAVDIGTQGWDQGRGPREVIVFEVNTAPALNEETAERYAEKVRERYET